ncbi:hypothetical protein PHET_11706 [Paragonimus heterotremus]|uniref:Uncharacterized protein n=1 Tax=Paragonimus heterotremus TaxID=100268 RepID=A0A8J4SZK5_9TREM|nr:hypothetical protein PHET_11706 [Paragonimus heterotremus]
MSVAQPEESTASNNSPALTNVVKRKRSILPPATMNKIAETSGPTLSRSGRVSINSDSNGKAVLGTENITRIGSSKMGHRTTHRRMSSQASARSQTAVALSAVQDNHSTYAAAFECIFKRLPIP